MTEKLLEDITGNKYGHLTVLEYVGKDNSRKSLWKCKCDCDAETLIITRGSDLRSGKTISCGCVNFKR
jgi:sigma54-dependent transcription regulator